MSDQAAVSMELFGWFILVIAFIATPVTIMLNGITGPLALTPIYILAVFQIVIGRYRQVAYWSDRGLMMERIKNLQEWEKSR